VRAAAGGSVIVPAFVVVFAKTKEVGFKTEDIL